MYRRDKWRANNGFGTRHVYQGYAMPPFATSLLFVFCLPNLCDEGHSERILEHEILLNLKMVHAYIGKMLRQVIIPKQ